MTTPTHPGPTHPGPLESMQTAPAATESTAAFAAAAAAAQVLPAVSPLTPGTPEPGLPTSAAGFAGAAIAAFEGGVPGAVAVVVGPELVDALASSPLGSLDLAAAAQPALDAAAQTLGAQVAAARSVPVDLVVNDLGQPFTLIPLQGAAGSAALLIGDAALRSATRGAAAAPGATGQPLEAAAPAPARGLEMLHGVIMDVTVELGRTRMSVRELLALTPGTVLELDRAAGSPADLLVNGRLIARGEVVVVDEDFGLRVTEIVDDASAS